MSGVVFKQRARDDRRRDKGTSSRSVDAGSFRAEVPHNALDEEQPVESTSGAEDANRLSSDQLEGSAGLDSPSGEKQRKRAAVSQRRNEPAPKRGMKTPPKATRTQRRQYPQVNARTSGWRA